MSAHWGAPDPAELEGDDAHKGLAFADTYHMLNIRIFTSLPIDSLDSLARQKRLDDIDHTKTDVTSEKA